MKTTTYLICYSITLNQNLVLPFHEYYTITNEFGLTESHLKNFEKKTLNKAKGLQNSSTTLDFSFTSIVKLGVSIDGQ